MPVKASFTAGGTHGCMASVTCMADCGMPYRIDVHASEGVHDSSASQQEHGRHQDVGHEAEEEECDVGGPAPARICTSTAISMSLSSNRILTHVPGTAEVAWSNLKPCDS